LRFRNAPAPFGGDAFLEFEEISLAGAGGHALLILVLRCVDRPLRDDPKETLVALGDRQLCDDDLDHVVH
jgi:hypothetical protein